MLETTARNDAFLSNKRKDNNSVYKIPDIDRAGPIWGDVTAIFEIIYPAWLCGVLSNI